MKNLKITLFSTLIAVSLIATSFPAFADELSEEEVVSSIEEAETAEEVSEVVETVEEVAEVVEEISEEDVETLEDASTVAESEEEAEESTVATETLVDGITTYTTSTSMANFAGLGYSNNNAGPISIVKATLVDESGNEKEVYVIGLSGTAFVENQATGIVSDILAGFNLSNPYLSATVTAIKENIPEGSNLILTGHSLGGMVAQEVASNSSIKKNYNVLNTVTFGAPLISAGTREGTTKRLGDKYDLIPYMSATGAILPIWSIAGLNREDGGYGSFTNFWSAHMGSYCRTDVWGSYDVLGYKNGTATLTYDVSEVQYYLAPTAW